MNDCRELFKTNQKLLLDIANTRAGRQLLDAKIESPIIKISPNAIIYGENSLKRGQFYCYDRQAKILLPLLEKLMIAGGDGLLNKAIKTFKTYGDIPYILLSQKNIYVTSGDGGLFGRFVVYATARGLATATGTTTTTCGNETVGGNFEIDRGFFPVNVSDIGRGAVVTQAIANLWKNSSNTTGHDDTSQFIQTTQADPTSLASSDYSAITLNSPTNLGTTASWSTISNGAYTQVTLNSDGKLLIQNNPAGYAKFGLRSTNDINATASVAPPTTDRSTIDFLYSNAGGTANDPYFDITWLAGGGFII